MGMRKLLTAWDNKEETAEYATGEVRDSTGATAATPTLNRRSGVNTTVSTDSIPNSDKNVKQFSLRDSDGNTLSEQQAEYFKDSKIRDEDGNLLVVYHGSDADFTVFDKTKGRAILPKILSVKCAIEIELSLHCLQSVVNYIYLRYSE